MATKKEPKQKPADKSMLLLEIARQATLYRTDTASPMILIPNHPTQKAPMSLFDNYEFVAWLHWRCTNQHGFIPTSAMINSVLDVLAGEAIYNPNTPIVTPEKRKAILDFSREEIQQADRNKSALEFQRRGPQGNRLI